MKKIHHWRNYFAKNIQGRQGQSWTFGDVNSDSVENDDDNDACTLTMHINSPVSHVQSSIASSSSLASFSTPVDKADCAKILSLYLRYGLPIGLQTLHGSKLIMTLCLPNGSRHFPPQQHRSPHLLTKQNLIRFMPCRDHIIILEEIWPCCAHTLCIPTSQSSICSHQHKSILLLISIIIHTC